MKKITLLMIGLLLMPTIALAAEDTEVFKIGDRIQVFIENDNEKEEFFVIKPSAAGEKYVWAILNGNIEDPYYEGDTTITVYDQTIPPHDENDEEHEASTNFETSVVKRLIDNATENWRKEEQVRLLNLQDIVDMGITKNNEGIYEIKGDRSFLQPIIFEFTASDPSYYNYWTMIPDNTKDSAHIFAVTYNEGYIGDSLSPIAFLQSYDISNITGPEPEFIVRPVVKIDKKYIDCFEEPPAPVPSPPTSQVMLPLAVFAIGGVATALYLTLNKKTVFQKY